MKIIPATCKFCKASINLNFDDSYASLERDPMGLIPLAACNKCGDARVTKRESQDKIQKICERLMCCCRFDAKGKPVSSKDEAKLRELAATLKEPMLKATKAYAVAHASVIQSKEFLWQAEFAELLLEMPTRWGLILQKYDNDCRKHRVPMKPTPVANSPISDEDIPLEVYDRDDQPQYR